MLSESAAALATPLFAPGFQAQRWSSWRWAVLTVVVHTPRRKRCAGVVGGTVHLERAIRRRPSAGY